MLVLEIDIDSYALRHRLNQEIVSDYDGEQNIITTQFSEDSTTFTVRRCPPISTEDEEDNAPKKHRKKQHKKVAELKLGLEHVRHSYFDKIIRGDIRPEEVIFEDESVIAFQALNPAAEVHFIVLAKQLDRHSLLDVEPDVDEAILGHMLVVTARLAQRFDL